jgi:hypothetical protein
VPLRFPPAFGTFESSPGKLLGALVGGEKYPILKNEILWQEIEAFGSYFLILQE